MSLRDEALAYHRQGRPGKIEVTPTKPLLTQHDLSLAYTPGVAQPVLDIAEDAAKAFEYTAKGNLVAVLSNGTAILGLGNLGALAAKPVMEGKGVLFKRFADVDVFDIEVDTLDPDEIIRVGQLIAPTFGGINLEDIKAPECFYIEQELERTTNIPIFHDDQHGTAIISGAALLNALELNGKAIADVRIVINGAGAAGIACADFYVALGATHANIMLCDSSGVVYQGRAKGMNPWKEKYAAATERRTLTDALVGADVFIGLSVANTVSAEMVRSMAEDPILFAMANPDPEIPYPDAMAARPDVIMGTGRSDYPNQVNNVLGFPFIFRGALDVQATSVNMTMKIAAARALAEMAHEDVPDSVLKAYGLDGLRFGRDYLIPKPLDPRVLTHVAPAVARAAMETGVARRQIDLEAYPDQLRARQGLGLAMMRGIIRQAQADPKCVALADGSHPRVIRAAHLLEQQGIARPILLGDPARIAAELERLGLDYTPTIIHPARYEQRETYAQALYNRRNRKGMTPGMARQLVTQPNYLGAIMVELGDADAFVSGLTYNYPDVLRPALQVVGTRADVSTISGVYMMIVRDKVYFFADATVNPDPTAAQLAEIAIQAAEVAQTFGVTPRVAMISFSNFGSTRFPQSEKVRGAVEIVRQLRPDLAVDGEMQADTAVSAELVDAHFPMSQVKGANVLVFPNLDAANAAYKLMARLGGAEAVGPILRGMNKPVHILPTGSEVRDIVNVVALAVVDAQHLAAQPG
ncbi:MAG: NADP-dependent malic enzyme [Caldilineales bacterium]|nr:NADP-dependent malic enzyme [Caldilineales bacterium]